MENFYNFVKMIRKVKKEHGDNVVFRGIVDYKGNQDELIPKIYRGKYEKKESDLINDIFSKMPQEFTDVSNNLEILLKLQHYGIPTRLLDVSFNPYIALYFACSGSISSNEESGFIYVIGGNNQLIKKSGQSDTVAIVSSISRLSCSVKKDLEADVNNYMIFKAMVIKTILIKLQKEDVKNFSPEHSKNWSDMDYEILDRITLNCSDETNKLIEGIIKNNLTIDEIHNKINTFLVTSDIEREKLNLKEALEIFQNATSILENLELHYTLFNFHKGLELDTEGLKKLKLAYNRKESVKKLLHEARNFRAGYRDELELEDLAKDYLVTSVVKNDRIKNQQGGFILQGLSKTLDKDYIIERWEIPHKVIFPKRDDGENFLSDLDTMNIHESFIYPELEHFDCKKYASE